jgi:ribose 5-phosphate isomerase A
LDANAMTTSPNPSPHAPDASPHTSIDQIEKEKQAAARAALAWVRSGTTLGLGTGTTARYFIQFLGERLRSERSTIEAVASSTGSEALAREAGIRVIAPRRGLRLDLTVDGADEIAPDLSLIKGHGGALLREKVLAQASRFFLVIADSTKRVDRLGTRTLPVEVVPFAAPWVADQVENLGGTATLMMNGKSRGEPFPTDQPFVTDQGNHILECKFRDINDPRTLGAQLENIPGLVAHGLFVGYANAALVGDAGNVWILRPGQAAEKFTGSALPAQP